jgi:hypothetical protein
MDPLWLLKGRPDAPGWLQLEIDARSNKVNVLVFDRDAWALMIAAEAPDQYEGLVPFVPPDGLYLDNSGRPCYVSGCREVTSARQVIKGLGAEAEAMLQKIGDADLVLERLGRSY